MFVATRGRIIEFAAKHHLPTAYAEEVFAYEGGLMLYGFELPTGIAALLGWSRKSSMERSPQIYPWITEPDFGLWLLSVA